MWQRVWETRKEEEEEEEVVRKQQKKPGEKWSGVCVHACHLFSLNHNLWGRQPVGEQEAEETVEVWVCVWESIKDEWDV